MQARANGELSHQIGSGPQAALISFSSGLFFISLFAIFSRRVHGGVRNLRAAVRSRKLPKWRLLAGALGGSFVAIQSSIVFLIGVATFSVASIAGQTALSLIVDRIGFTGGGPKKITLRRVAAATMTVVAVLVSVWDKLEGIDFSHLSVFLAAFAGALVGIQRALNGQINEHTGDSYTTTLLNFITGTTLLLIFLVTLIALGRIELQPLATGPWWIYTGGILGVTYIAFSALIVQHLGVLNFTLYSVGGQLIGALLLDLYLPSAGISVSWYLLSGIALTYVGVIIGGTNQSRRARM